MECVSVYSYSHYFIFILHGFITSRLNDWLPVGLLAQYWLECCSGIIEVKGRIPYKPDFLSGFLFTTAKLVSITAMIFFTYKYWNGYKVEFHF